MTIENTGEGLPTRGGVEDIKTEGEYIDITPTWRSIMPVLWEAAVNGTTYDGRKSARDELYRLADMADAIIAAKVAQSED